MQTVNLKAIFRMIYTIHNSTFSCMTQAIQIEQNISISVLIHQSYNTQCGFCIIPEACINMGEESYACSSYELNKHIGMTLLPVALVMFRTGRSLGLFIPNGRKGLDVILRYLTLGSDNQIILIIYLQINVKNWINNIKTLY